MLVFNQDTDNEVTIHFNEFNDLEVRYGFKYGMVSSNSNYELYSLQTFKLSQLDIKQLTCEQNETLRKFINVYEYELSQLKQFYQLENNNTCVIGYGAESNNKVKEGFYMALNRVYNVCNSLAIAKAKLHIQDLL